MNDLVDLIRFLATYVAIAVGVGLVALIVITGMIVEFTGFRWGPGCA